jgi:hypothetical protein
MFPLLDDEYSARAHLAHKPRGGIEGKKTFDKPRRSSRRNLNSKSQGSTLLFGNSLSEQQLNSSVNNDNTNDSNSGVQDLKPLTSLSLAWL